MRILKWFQQRDAEMSVRVGKARNNTVRLTGTSDRCGLHGQLPAGMRQADRGRIIGILFHLCERSLYLWNGCSKTLCAEGDCGSRLKAVFLL